MLECWCVWCQNHKLLTPDPFYLLSTDISINRYEKERGKEAGGSLKSNNRSPSLVSIGEAAGGGRGGKGRRGVPLQIAEANTSLLFVFMDYDLSASSSPQKKKGMMYQKKNVKKRELREEEEERNCSEPVASAHTPVLSLLLNQVTPLLVVPISDSLFPPPLSHQTLRHHATEERERKAALYQHVE